MLATTGYGRSDLRWERSLEAVVHRWRERLRHRHVSTPPSTGECACGFDGSEAGWSSPRAPRARREAQNTKPGTNSVRTKMPRSGTAQLSGGTFPKAARLRAAEPVGPVAPAPLPPFPPLDFDPAFASGEAQRVGIGEFARRDAPE